MGIEVSVIPVNVECNSLGHYSRIQTFYHERKDPTEVKSECKKKTDFNCFSHSARILPLVIERLDSGLLGHYIKI